MIMIIFGFRRVWGNFYESSPVFWHFGEFCIWYYTGWSSSPRCLKLQARIRSPHLAGASEAPYWEELPSEYSCSHYTHLVPLPLPFNENNYNRKGNHPIFLYNIYIFIFMWRRPKLFCQPSQKQRNRHSISMEQLSKYANALQILNLYNHEKKWRQNCRRWVV